MATLKNLPIANAGFHEKPPGIQKALISIIRENRRKKPPKKIRKTPGGRPAKKPSKDPLKLATMSAEDKAKLIAILEKGKSYG